MKKLITYYNWGIDAAILLRKFLSSNMLSKRHYDQKTKNL